MFRLARNIFLLLLVAVPCICFGQKPRFRLFLTKACQTIEQLDTSYHLEPLNGLDTAYSPTNGIVSLPAVGHYVIVFSPGGPIPDSSLVNITDTTLFTFRYKEPSIGLYSFNGFDGLPQYRKCGVLINGYQEDFHPNGKIKMRGVFKDGWPTDSIVSFYYNGKVKRRTINTAKTVTSADFDSLGNISRLYKGENKSYMIYHEYAIKLFYANGKIKRNESLSKRVHSIEAYYPDGSIKFKHSKKQRIEYFPNGTVQFKYTWKDSTEDKKDKWKTFVIYKKRYDQNGSLLESAAYEEWGYIDSQPDVNISRSDWIEFYEKYENGKKVFELLDVNMKDYKKVHPNAFRDEDVGYDNQ